MELIYNIYVICIKLFKPYWLKQSYKYLYNNGENTLDTILIYAKDSFTETDKVKVPWKDLIFKSA